MNAPRTFLLALLLAAAATAAVAAPAQAAGAAPAAHAAPTPGAPLLAAASGALAEVARGERTFLARHLPPALMEVGPLGLRWWQWVAMPLAALLALALGWVAGWATRRLLGHLASRTSTSWDDLLIARLASPITLFWALVVASALRPMLALDGGLDEALGRALKAGFFLAEIGRAHV